MNRFAWRALVTAIVGIAGIACSEITPSESRRLRISLSDLARAGAVNPPFVSVVDSVTLVIKANSNGNTRLYGACIDRGQKLSQFDVPLARDTYTFSTGVTSNNGSTLFVGDTTITIDSDVFTLRLGLSPLAPVLLVAPDTASTKLDNGKSFVAQFAVHNRGIDSLVWTLRALPSAIQNCPFQCGLSPESGHVAGNESQTITVFVPDTSASQTLCFTLTSKQGDVPVCWKY